MANVFHTIHIVKLLLLLFLLVTTLVLFRLFNSEKKMHFGHSSTENNGFILQRTILIDEKCIAKLQSKEKCAFPIEVAIVSNVSILAVNELKNPFLKMTYWAQDRIDRDFLLFKSTKMDRNESFALKRFPTAHTSFDFSGTLYLLEFPTQLDKFRQQWQNGRFFECQIVLRRNETELKRFLPLTMLDRGAELTAHMERFNLTPFLLGGTLLGWRRECSLIPHTGDLDFGIFATQHSPAFLDNLIHSKKFLLKWILGHPRDTLELTLWMDDYKTDIFYIYKNKTRAQSYMSGMRVERRQNMRWYYPHFDKLCAAEMRGHLFHVPCNHDEIIAAEYGDEWKKDFPTNQFSWDKSHKNAESGEVYTEEEWKQRYNLYWPKEEHNQTLPRWD